MLQLRLLRPFSSVTHWLAVPTAATTAPVGPTSDLNSQAGPTLYLYQKRRHYSGVQCFINVKMSTLYIPVSNVYVITAVCFTRVTICASDVFAVARCPSVCHVGGLYPHGWRYRHFLVRPGSSVTLVFLTPSAGIQFQGEPLQRGVKYTGLEKLAIFD